MSAEEEECLLPGLIHQVPSALFFCWNCIIPGKAVVFNRKPCDLNHMDDKKENIFLTIKQQRDFPSLKHSVTFNV